MATAPIENYNSDNILVRNVIAGVLSILNKSIKYEKNWFVFLVDDYLFWAYGSECYCR